MKLLLVSKEDWRNVSLGVSLFNVIFDAANLLVIVVIILEFLDWIGLI